MGKLIRLPEAALLCREQYGFFDDFQGFLTADSTDLYTVLTTTDGSVLLTDARAGGVAILTAAATAGNEETYLAREPEAFKAIAGAHICFGALVQATEDDTNQNNLIVGLTDAMTTALMRDNGAGPKTSGSTFAFYKVDGGLNWWVHVSNSTTQTSVELTATNSYDNQAHVGSGSADQFLEIEFQAKTSTTGDVIFKIDGATVYKITDYVYTSATDMQAVCGAKDGDSGDEVTINLKAWYCYQNR